LAFDKVDPVRAAAPEMLDALKRADKFLATVTAICVEGGAGVKRHSLERLDSMIEAVSGNRLTYAGLTA
jgi:hypothetical protein